MKEGTREVKSCEATAVVEAKLWWVLMCISNNDDFSGLSFFVVICDVGCLAVGDLSKSTLSLYESCFFEDEYEQLV